nr:restriction endonuclease subunit S [Methylobacterium sp. BTF04]
MGAIPSDWIVAGLKHRFNIIGGSTPKSDVSSYWDGDLPWITPADLSKRQSRFIAQTIRSITKAGLISCGTTLVPPDSVVLSTRAPIGSLAITAVEACTNQGCKALVPLGGAESTFAFYVLSVATEQLNVRGKGTTFLELSSDELGAFRLAFPPIPQQRAISAFLDHETAKIDTLVEEQRRLIALLKEKRQAVISHAVTKGLTPDAPMKDSGIEWLGKVPAHWTVSALKRLFASADYGISDSLEPDGSVAVLRMGNISGGKVALNDLKFVKTVDKNLLLDINDLLFNRTNSLDQIAKVGIFKGADFPVSFASYLVRFRANNQNSPHFMTLLLNLEQLLGLARSRAFVAIGQCNLNPTRYGEIKVAVPPIEEQHEIVDALKGALHEIEALIDAANQALELLNERRAALISAAVTGKIDVRDVADVLPFPIDRVRARGLIATEIVERSAFQSTFGRVKLQKIAYLAQVHAGVSELEGAYLREAAGPLDREMISDMEREAARLAGIRVEQPHGVGSAVTYRLGDRRAAHRQELTAMLGVRTAKFDKLIEDTATIDTKGAEAVATLYAVWNDALIDGETPPDMEIALAVLSEWHPEKARKFRIDELQTWLGWMRRHGLVPTGVRPRTSTGRLFA